MIDFQIPLSGMNSASASLDRAAGKIADAADPSGATASDSMDLSAEMVQLMEARNNFSANVKVAQTYDEMSRSLLNIVG